MALAVKAYADRVQETTTTTGTGTLNLGGASAQCQTFVNGIGNGNVCDYTILAGNGSDWEVGIGTVTSGSPATLSRDTILASSNSGSAISLTGTSTVYCDFPAKRAGQRGLLNEVQSTTVPTSSNTGYTTWNNQGGATVADNKAGVAIGITSGNGSAHVLRTRTKAAPTAPYTCTFCHLLNAPLNFSCLFVGWNDGTKFQGFLVQQDNVFESQWNSNISQSAANNKSWQKNASNMAHVWTRLKRDNSNNVQIDASIDGENWHSILAVVATSSGFLGSSGYSNVCWGIDNYSNPGYFTLTSYTEGP